MQVDQRDLVERDGNQSCYFDWFKWHKASEVWYLHQLKVPTQEKVKILEEQLKTCYF